MRWLCMMMIVLGLSQQVCAEDTKTPAPLVVLIGGLDSDPTPAQIEGTAQRGVGNSGMFQLAGDLKEHALECCYFNWNGTTAGDINVEMPPLSDGIAQHIRTTCEHVHPAQLIIVGNSWGGHTACEVCDLLNAEPKVPVDFLVLLDPSSTGRTTSVPKALPENVKVARNYSTRNVFAWGKWIAEPRITFVDLGDPEAGFLRDPYRYDSKFDFQAHVAAEWDMKIHRDIQQRILDLRTPMKTGK
ncbi:MAG: hypothetical protein R3C18_01290 [Planctomycetaceae bacterium]